MGNNIIGIITILYGIAGIIAFFGYFPTIIDLWNRKPSANLLTYIVWTFTSISALLYGYYILDDIVFTLIVGLQAFACLIILGLNIRLKPIKIRRFK